MTADTDHVADDESAQAALRVLEGEVAKLRGGVEALGVLADAAIDGGAGMANREEPGMGGGIPGEALAWTVRQLKAQLDVMDRLIRES